MIVLLILIPLSILLGYLGGTYNLKKRLESAYILGKLEMLDTIVSKMENTDDTNQ